MSKKQCQVKPFRRQLAPEYNGCELSSKVLSQVYEMGSQIDRLLASIVESSDDAIISQDLHGIITSWNKAAERIFGYPAGEALGQPISILTPEDRAAEMTAILDQIRQGRRVDHIEMVGLTKDDRSLNLLLTISAIRGADGQIVGASSIAREITERKMEEELLTAQAERLARSTDDLEQFAYVTAHDLQEPLRGICAMSELLQRRYEGRLDAGADELIRHIVASASRMRNLIRDLLKYSQIINPEEMPLLRVGAKAAVDWALNNLQRAIEESGAVIEVGQLPEVRGDMVNLVQLFQNLIGNAIKYRSSCRPRITISANSEPHQWVFSISDNGIGIAPAYHRTIFGVFKRLHGSLYQGTGIGLALCRRIVEKHNGKIWVESNSGKGATFKFTIPAEAA